MTALDWFWKRTFFWLCITYHLNTVGIDGHHNDTCLSSDGNQAICVANRYCRERFKHHLLPCEDGKICCPLPTSPSPSTTASSEQPARRPTNSEGPKSQDDAYSRGTEDGPLRKPISTYDRPVKELPSERPAENERPRYKPEVYDTEDEYPRSPPRKPVPKYSSPSLEEDERSRRPAVSYSRPIDKIPDRRPVERGRPRDQIDDGDRPRPSSLGDDGRSRRKPIDDYDKPKEEIPRRKPEVEIPRRRPEEEIPRRRPEEEIPRRRPEERDRPKQNADDLLPSRAEDRGPRKPISEYDKPREDIPSRRPEESGRPRNNEGNAPSMHGGGYSRLPVDSRNKPPKDIPPRRPVNNERPRQSKPTNDGREPPRKPVDYYDEPVDETPTRVRDEYAKPGGRPRYDERLERPPIKPGKVKFEDDSVRGREDRPIERGRDTVGDYDSRSEDFPMPRRESTASKNNRDDSDIDGGRPRPDDYDRRRQTGDVPRHYPSRDLIDVHRDRPRSELKPTRVLSGNHTIDVSKSTHEFPETHEFLPPQPKVPECGVKPYELFIAGGEASDPHEWPWMTAIFRRHQNSRPKTFICGGALINTKYVLTAAHCFVHNYVVLPASTFVVRVGSHQLSSGEEYTISNLVIHHNHSGSDFFNDIALMKLASEVYVTDKVAPICLPFPDMAGDDFVGRIATVAGWGDTAYRTGGARTLQHVAIPIVSSEECFSAYSRVRGAAFLARGSDHVICAGLREGGKDACLGDSGGPLMLKAAEDRWIVVGIVSLGYKCAEPGYPGVYTRVTHYTSWIQNNMKRH